MLLPFETLSPNPNYNKESWAPPYYNKYLRTIHEVFLFRTCTWAFIRHSEGRYVVYFVFIIQLVKKSWLRDSTTYCVKKFDLFEYLNMTTSLQEIVSGIRSITTVDLALKASNLFEKTLWTLIGISGTIWAMYFMTFQVAMWMMKLKISMKFTFFSCLQIFPVI